MSWSSKLAVKTFSLALGGLTLGAAAEAQAAYLCSWRTVSTISSGVTDTSVLAPGAANAYPAFTVAADPAYSTISGTSWINYNPSIAGTPYAAASYFTYVYVPYWDYDTVDMRLRIEVNADNVATFYINGGQVYQQTWGEVASNFQSPAELAYTQAYFNVGAYNQVQINVQNFSGPTALNYRISVQEQVCRETCVNARAADGSEDMVPICEQPY
jgi:hypothetical protein